MSDSTGQSNSGNRGPFRVGEWRKPFEIVDTIQIMQDGREWPVAFIPDAVECEDFATKVAACLNACDGINPEAVPELVKAAENAIGMMQMAWKQYGVGGMFECMDALRSSLAKAKGGVA